MALTPGPFIDITAVAAAAVGPVGAAPTAPCIVSMAPVALAEKQPTPPAVAAIPLVGKSAVTSSSSDIPDVVAAASTGYSSTMIPASTVDTRRELSSSELPSTPTPIPPSAVVGRHSGAEAFTCGQGARIGGSPVKYFVVGRGPVAAAVAEPPSPAVVSSPIVDEFAGVGGVLATGGDLNASSPVPTGASVAPLLSSPLPTIGIVVSSSDISSNTNSATSSIGNSGSNSTNSIGGSGSSCVNNTGGGSIVWVAPGHEHPSLFFNSLVASLEDCSWVAGGPPQQLLAATVEEIDGVFTMQGVEGAVHQLAGTPSSATVTAVSTTSPPPSSSDTAAHPSAAIPATLLDAEAAAASGANTGGSASDITPSSDISPSSDITPSSDPSINRAASPGGGSPVTPSGSGSGRGLRVRYRIRHRQEDMGHARVYITTTARYEAQQQQLAAGVRDSPTDVSPPLWHVGAPPRTLWQRPHPHHYSADDALSIPSAQQPSRSTFPPLLHYTEPHLHVSLSQHGHRVLVVEFDLPQRAVSPGQMITLYSDHQHRHSGAQRVASAAASASPSTASATTDADSAAAASTSGSPIPAAGFASTGVMRSEGEVAWDGAHREVLGCARILSGGPSLWDMGLPSPSLGGWVE